MSAAPVRRDWATIDGARVGLLWALSGAAGDPERCGFISLRVRTVLKASRKAIDQLPMRSEMRFLRDLAFAWLDAPDGVAVDVARRAIADYLATLNAEAAS